MKCYPTAASVGRSCGLMSVSAGEDAVGVINDISGAFHHVLKRSQLLTVKNYQFWGKKRKDFSNFKIFYFFFTEYECDVMLRPW